MTAGTERPGEGLQQANTDHQSSTSESSRLFITMGLTYNVYLSSSRIYGCKNCKTHLSNHDDILSRVRLLS